MMVSPREIPTPRSPVARRQLLISVRDRAEAEICLKAGVDWIDLKEPLAGPLGMPSLPAATEVYQVLRHHPCRSVALGELADEPSLATVQSLSRLFPIVKFGLAGTAGRKDWKEQLAGYRNQISGNLVPVIYADWQACQSPEPSQILDWLSRFPTPYLLVDTFFKDGRHLLQHLDEGQLSSLIDGARLLGSKVILGGSLTLQQIPTALSLPCEAVAVRGAACRSSRQGDICDDLVGLLVNLVKQTSPKTVPE
jgi:(5-formylfuran-3-yl)methyl phosphate synthase